MLRIFFYRNFRKDYRKLSERIKSRGKERIALFCKDPFDPIISNHALAGKFRRYRSIDISGDLRVVHAPIGENIVEFVLIGTHHDLYGK